MRMFTIKKIYFLLFAAFVAILGYQGCSQLDKNAVVAPTIGQVHPNGWLDTLNIDNPNFHAKYLPKINWNLRLCQSCHGSDFSGGNTGVGPICLNCHTSPGGPAACNNCHGAKTSSSSKNDFDPAHPWPPLSLHGDSLEMDRGVGVHKHHLSSDPNERYSAQVRCIDCHARVSSFSDPNHIQNTNGHATIRFDSLAINTLTGDTTIPHPVYDQVANTCANVYCHGNFKNGNRGFQPTFNDPNSVTCGSCHGDPVTGNPNPGAPNNFVPPHLSSFTINTCYQCHGSVIDQTGTIIAPEKHINGIVNP